MMFVSIINDCRVTYALPLVIAVVASDVVRLRPRVLAASSVSLLYCTV